jgi:hypothetical protein
LEVVSRGVLHKEPCPLALYRGPDSRTIDINKTLKTPGTLRLITTTPQLSRTTHYHSPPSLSTAAHHQGLASYPPPNRQAGFLNRLHHDALAAPVSTPSLPRPAAEQAAASSSQEGLSTPVDATPLGIRHVACFIIWHQALARRRDRREHTP